jgi:Glycosyltransferase family 92
MSTRDFGRRARRRLVHAAQEWRRPNVEVAITPADARRNFGLAVCSMFRNEAPFLEEWIEFHRLVGVEKFILFDNNSEDGSRAVLAPYVERGIVTVYAMPRFRNEFDVVVAMQSRAFNACLGMYRDRARWIAFLDLDEFLYPTALDSLPEFLREFEAYPALAVHWVQFSTSGHVLRQDDLVTSAYTVAAIQGSKHLKVIVDPSRTVGFFGSSHVARYVGDEKAVDENHVPIATGYRRPPTVERIRINHYYTKSVEDFLLGKDLGEGGHNAGHRPVNRLFLAEREYASGVDTSIQRFIPRLREAMQP